MPKTRRSLTITEEFLLTQGLDPTEVALRVGETRTHEFCHEVLVAYLEVAAAGQGVQVTVTDRTELEWEVNVEGDDENVELFIRLVLADAGISLPGVSLNDEE